MSSHPNLPLQKSISIPRSQTSIKNQRLKTEYPLSSRVQTEEYSLTVKENKNPLFSPRNRFTELNFGLNLAEKGITHFPIDLYRIRSQNLKVLDLRDNKIEKIDYELKSFVNLTQLKLDNNNLKEISKEIFALPLKFLSLSNNFIKYIPKEIENLKNIEYLNISFNIISSLPKELANLPKMKSIHINNNPFYEIPIEIVHFFSTLSEIGLDWFKYGFGSKDPIYKNSSLLDENTQKNNIEIKKTPPHKIVSTSMRLSSDNFKIVSFDRKNSLNTFSTLNFKNFSQSKTMIDVNDFLQVLFSSKKNIFILESLLKATLDEDLGILRFIIMNKRELINELNKDSLSALTISILNEKYISSKVFIQNNCDVNIGGGAYGSALNVGVSKLQIYLVKDLIKYGAELNKLDKKGNNLFAYLFSHFEEDPEIAEKMLHLIIENGAGYMINKKNNEGFTALNLAFLNKWKTAIHAFLKINEKIDVLDLNFNCEEISLSYLHQAVILENIDIVEMIIHQKKSDPDILDQRDPSGQRPINHAKKNYTIIKLVRYLERREFANFALKNLKLKKRNINTKIIVEEKIDKSSFLSEDDVSPNLNLKMNQIKTMNMTSLMNCRKCLTTRIKKNEDTYQNINDEPFEEESHEEYEEFERKKNVKQITITPNNIKKIERIQKYFAAAMNKNGNNEDLKLIPSKDKYVLNESAMAVLKRTIEVTQNIKRKLQEASEKIISEYVPFHIKLHHINEMFKISSHLKLISEEMNKKEIPLTFIELNFFESRNINNFNPESKTKQSRFSFFTDVINDLIQKLKQFGHPHLIDRLLQLCNYPEAENHLINLILDKNNETMVKYESYAEFKLISFQRTK